MADLTAVILTKDEEKNIAACLDSIKGFAARAVVVDCGSRDQTVEKAKERGADVITHPFTYYAAQFNYALDNTDIRTKWVLRLDADERMTPEVIAHAEELMLSHAGDDVNGIVMQADFYFLGKLMKHGVTNKRKIMLFKASVGRIEDRKRDAHTVLSAGRTVEIPERFLHCDFKDLQSYIARYNWYAGRELYDYVAYREGISQNANTDAVLMRHRKRKFSFYYRAPRFFRAWLWFVYNYYFRLGFLDGKEGYIYSYFEYYWYRFLIDARIFEYEKTGAALDELKAFGE